MPGISVVKGNIVRGGNSENNEVGESILSSALSSVMHNDRYIQEILLNEESFLIACTKYPEYPTTIYEDDHFWVCIEGKIYGQDDFKIKREINTLLFEI